MRLLVCLCLVLLGCKRVQPEQKHYAHIEWSVTYPQLPIDTIIAESKGMLEPDRDRFITRSIKAFLLDLPAHCNAYHVYRYEPEAGYKRLTEGPVFDTQYTDDTIKVGVHYTYAVTTLCLTTKGEVTNESVFSDPIDLEVPFAKPTAPKDLSYYGVTRGH